MRRLNDGQSRWARYLLASALAKTNSLVTGTIRRQGNSTIKFGRLLLQMGFIVYLCLFYMTLSAIDARYAMYHRPVHEIASPYIKPQCLVLRLHSAVKNWVELPSCIFSIHIEKDLKKTSRRKTENTANS